MRTSQKWACKSPLSERRFNVYDDNQTLPNEWIAMIGLTRTSHARGADACRCHMVVVVIKHEHQVSYLLQPRNAHVSPYDVHQIGLIKG